MDKKIDLDTLKLVLRDHLEDNKQAQILAEINQILQEEQKEKESKEKLPPVAKKQVVIITGAPEGWEKNPKLFEELSGFITDVQEETPLVSIKEKIFNAKKDYSFSKKARKNPADTFGDLFELAPTRIFKDNGLLKKPKGPLEFIFTSNK